MTEKLNYNDDVLTVMFEDIKTTQQATNDKIDKGFARFEEAQEDENKRISRNELNIAFAQGGLAVVMIIVLPMLAWALWTLVNIPQQINETVNKAVSQALSVYEK